MRRLVLTVGLVAVCLAGFVSQLSAQEKDTPRAAATRKLLKTKISVEYKDTILKDVMDDIKDQIQEKTKKKIFVIYDNKGGVSLNTKFTYKADDKPLETILDEMFKKNDLGYVVVQKGAYPGALEIVKGKARGYLEKKE
ncbi:MAG TPA: hypothetical protein VMG10_23525 [Gemmataceae bacterium]|nr:hypothetical protein [Gemmataceae bacterium]